MKVLIAAGGTGGHIYPGIAIAREILRRSPESEVLFVGTARGIETRIVPENGFQLALINSAGLKNVGFAGKVKGMAILPKSFLEAREVIRDFRPDVVVGAGGYVSGPVLLMAHFMRFPTLVMDSNALPGFTNRRLARFVDKAALTFDAALPFFGKKGIVTGNPVRKEFFNVGKREAGERLQILIFGGSQGSVAINRAVIEALPFLDEIKDRLEITHQTGDLDFETVRKAYDDAGWAEVDVRPFISEIVNEFEKADIIISRAGATTCAELAAAGRVAIMIPLPGAADDHQRKNAEAFEKAGGAKMILQQDANGRNLADAISQLVGDREKLRSMQEAVRKLARNDAAEATVNLIEELAAAKK